MEAARSSETLVANHYISRHNNPEHDEFKLRYICVCVWP